MRRMFIFIIQIEITEELLLSIYDLNNNNNNLVLNRLYESY